MTAEEPSSPTLQRYALDCWDRCLSGQDSPKVNAHLLKKAPPAISQWQPTRA